MKQNRSKIIAFGIAFLTSIGILLVNTSLLSQPNAIDNLGLAALGIADLLMLAIWIIIFNLITPQSKSKEIL